MSGEAKCQTCGALILWVTMVPSRKRCPLNPVPSAAGNIERKRGNSSDTYYGRVVPKDDRRMHSKLYKTHFASCKQADLWRDHPRGTRSHG